MVIAAATLRFSSSGLLGLVLWLTGGGLFGSGHMVPLLANRVVVRIVPAECLLYLALHNFAPVHEAIPAGYRASEAGQPLLSWRVHILPYLEEQELYDKFHLDEPWDSPHNKQLTAGRVAASIGQTPIEHVHYLSLFWVSTAR